VFIESCSDVLAVKFIRTNDFVIMWSSLHCAPLLGSSHWRRGNLVYFSKAEVCFWCWWEKTVSRGETADWSDIPTVYGLEGLPGRWRVTQGWEDILQEQVLTVN